MLETSSLLSSSSLLSWDESPWLLVGVLVTAVALVLFGSATRLYQKVDLGRALLVNKLNRVEVLFTGGLVIPVVHRAEVMDISVKTIEVERKGSRGLHCKDDIRADVAARFFVRVNPTEEDVLEVAQTIGTARASHPQTLDRLFRAKFSSALETVCKRLDFEELYTHRREFKQYVLEVIGEDLNGYAIDDAVIDYLEQTPVATLDPNNVLDARGIRKITELTAMQAVETNGLRRDEQQKLRKTDVEAREAILELDRQQACATATQARRAASAWARAQAGATQSWAEARKRAELARIETEREVTFGNGRRKRETALAHKNRERAVALEQCRAYGAQQLALVERERAAQLSRISNRRALEREKADAAVLTRGRVAALRAVAQEQERIADVRVIARAERLKEARRVYAEAQAERSLVEIVKRAEARARAAEHTARATVTEAEATLAASDANTRAMLRHAEGVEAEQAARGLARVEVRQASADAMKARGDARARATLAQMQAEARGQQAQGLAQARVEQARAATIAQTGHAVAEALRERMLARATGKERQGLAEVAVKNADAAATEAMGRARAAQLREALRAEALGLRERAEALGRFDSRSRTLDKTHYAWGTLAEVQKRCLAEYRERNA